MIYTLKASDTDIFFFLAVVPQNRQLLPLVSDVVDNTVFIPLPPGNTYSLLALAVDHVGNRQLMEWNRAIAVDFSLPTRGSHAVKHCLL